MSLPDVAARRLPVVFGAERPTRKREERQWSARLETKAMVLRDPSGPVWGDLRQWTVPGGAPSAGR